MLKNIRRGEKWQEKQLFLILMGTLWDSCNEIPESTVEAIRKLRENGNLAFCAAEEPEPIFRIRPCWRLDLMGLCPDAVL